MKPVRSKTEIWERLAEYHHEVGQLGVDRLGLFGSFLRDEARPDSDVDFLVFFRAGEKTYSNLFELVRLLERLLGRNVELVTPESLTSRLRTQILEDVEYVEGVGTSAWTTIFCGTSSRIEFPSCINS